MQNAASSTKSKGLLGGFIVCFAWLSGKRFLQENVRKHHLLQIEHHLTYTLISKVFDISILAFNDVPYILYYRSISLCWNNALRSSKSTASA